TPTGLGCNVRRVPKLVIHRLARRIKTRDDALLVLAAASQSLYALALISLAYFVSPLTELWRSGQQSGLFLWATCGLLSCLGFFALTGYFLSRRKSRLIAVLVLCSGLAMLAACIGVRPAAHWHVARFVFVGLWILTGASAVRATWMFHRRGSSRLLLGNV